MEVRCLARHGRIVPRTNLVPALCLAIGTLVAHSQADQALRQPTHIAPQPLAQALETLAKDRHIQLVYRSELVGDRRTPGAWGMLTFEEALTQLLVGSGLKYSYLNEDAVMLMRESSAD